MPVSILMPALSPTMEMGTLAKWYVKEGEKVVAGDILADIETDKATMEFEAIEDGKITNLFVSEGTTNIAVNQPIAELTLEDEQASSKKIKDLDYVNKVTQRNNDKTNSSKDPMSALNNQITKSKINPDKNRIKISPLAKSIASNHQIDVANILGSGPHGRIIKNDVLQLLNSGLEAPNKNVKNDAKLELLKSKNTNKINGLTDIYHDRQYKIIPLNGIRKVIANRLTEAKRTIPHFYLRRTVHLDKLIKLRLELNELFQSSTIKFSINDFIIKAVAKSLQDNPKCNVIWADDNIIQLQSSDISVAVALEDGLITPIIRDTEVKSLTEISLEMKEKAERAKEKKLLPWEYTGGSCSISNLGMMGIENFDAVINPPQASILAVGSAIKKPLVNENGEMYVGHAMSVNLSADHRVIDGAVGSLFLSSIVDYLTNPLKLMI